MLERVAWGKLKGCPLSGIGWWSSSKSIALLCACGMSHGFLKYTSWEDCLRSKYHQVPTSVEIWYHHCLFRTVTVTTIVAVGTGFRLRHWQIASPRHLDSSRCGLGAPQHPARRQMIFFPRWKARDLASENEARHGPIPEENATVILWHILTFSVFFPLKFHEISTNRGWMVRLGWTAYPCFCNKSDLAKTSGPRDQRAPKHNTISTVKVTRGREVQIGWDRVQVKRTWICSSW